MKTNAAEYAKAHKISISGARARLQKMVYAGKARRITSCREWYNRFPGRNGQMFGTVPTIDYEIFDETTKEQLPFEA